MKKRIMTAGVALMLSSTMLLTSCFGEFALVRKVYDFNEDASSNKFVQSLLFWGMSIIPVYGVAALVDVVIFNLIEFWSGSNPIAMKEGEVETQNIAYKGINYQIEASKNQFAITPLEGNNAFETSFLKFNPDNNIWSHVSPEGIQTPMVGTHETEEGLLMELIMNNDQSIFVTPKQLEESTPREILSLEGC
jgi:hypothetical protein